MQKELVLARACSSTEAGLYFLTCCQLVPPDFLLRHDLLPAGSMESGKREDFHDGNLPVIPC